MIVESFGAVQGWLLISQLKDLKNKFPHLKPDFLNNTNWYM